MLGLQAQGGAGPPPAGSSSPATLEGSYAGSEHDEAGLEAGTPQGQEYRQHMPVQLDMWSVKGRRAKVRL